MNTVEALTAEFYDWEASGRGWASFDFPVSLEPAFRPFIRGTALPSGFDDGRQDTWLSKLADRLRFGKTADAPQLPPRQGEISLPEPRDAFPDWREFEMLVPADAKIDGAGTLGWIQSISTVREPLAFEIIGSGRTVSIQLTCDARDHGIVADQFRAFFPAATLREPTHSLESRWQDTIGETAVLEFGLAREFMLPLRLPSGSDPLTPFVGALAGLRTNDIAVLQLLFQPVHHPWAESISRAVTTSAGRPFFADAPEITALAREKISAPLYAVVVRAGVKAETTKRAWELLRGMSGGLAQFGSPDRNEFVPLAQSDSVESDLIARITRRSGMIWSASELTAFVHPPDRSLQLPALRRQVEVIPAAPADVVGDEGVVLGETNHRGETISAHLPTPLRLKHVHVIGASGTGKSTLLIKLILQDIEAGRGVGVIDPHGDLIDEVLARIPERRINDVVLFDPADDDWIVGWNILKAHSPSEKEMLASDLVAVFKRLSTSWGDQMTAVLANAILAFLESEQGGTLADLRRFLVDEEFRAGFLRTVKDSTVVGFWQHEFALLVGKKPQGPILTRLDTFLRSRLVRDAVTEETRPLDFRSLVDGQRMFLGRLSQGAIGQENAALLGALLVSKFHQVSLTRQDKVASERQPFFLYVDEFQDVATPSMSTLFAGVRKYHLGLTVAHQDLYQLHAKLPEVEQAVLSNAYTRICFRVAEDDARRLERGLGRYTADDLMNLRTGEAVCRVGRKEDDFRLSTHRLEDCRDAESRRAVIRRQSMERYGRQRSMPVPAKTAVVDICPEIRRDLPAQPEITTLKTPTPTPPVRTTSPIPRPVTHTPGRGGPEHKYLQELIRQWGHERGFRVTLEHVLPDAGRVDVLLERADISVACEIGMTTTIDHEIANIKKCLTGGFTHVVAVSMKKAFLKQLATTLKKDRRDGYERVKFLAPEELLSLLDELAAEPREGSVAGYAVRVRYRPAENDDVEARKRVVSDIISKRIRQLKGTGT